MDLYKVYKLIKQRSRRNPDNFLFKEMTILARRLFDPNINKDDLFDIASQLYAIEKNMPNIKSLFSIRILDALKSGNYTLDRPYQIRHQFDNDKKGWVYIAAHHSRSHQLKIGATTLAPYKRMQKYSLRYGYMPVIKCSFLSDKPFLVEADIKKKISDNIYSGCTNGESNEWYYINIKDLTFVVKNSLSRFEKITSDLEV